MKKSNNLLIVFNSTEKQSKIIQSNLVGNAGFDKVAKANLIIVCRIKNNKITEAHIAKNIDDENFSKFEIVEAKYK